MQLDPNAIADFAQKVTITGAFLFAIIASYLGKYQWTWQVEKQLAVKDALIAERDSRIQRLEESILGYKQREDDTNEEYRKLAWDAINAANTANGVGQQLAVAVRNHRGR
jgi:hypothetical protein